MAIDYLMGNGSKPGSYTLQGGPYPNLGGMMTWSINWDAVTNCNNSAYEYATNYENIFPIVSDCQQPNLGADVSACGLTFPYTLNSQTTTNTNVIFTWTNLSTNTVLVNNSATAITLAISTAGTYQVSRDSAGCSKTDEIIISADLSTPNLPSSVDLCLTLPASLSVLNTDDFPNETSWIWYKNDLAITEATTSTYADIRSAGTYKVAATYGNCTTENSLVVTSDLPAPIDACGNVGSTITLGLNGDAEESYEWYATITGGTLLGTGLSFTTPILSESTTYYVATTDAVGNATTGPTPTNNDLGTLGNYFNPHELYFDASTNFILKGLTIYPLIYCGTHTVSLEIRDAENRLLTNGQHDFSLSGDVDCAALDTDSQTISFAEGINIPQGTGYKLIITSTVGVNFWEGSVSYPMNYAPFFSITGSDVADKYLATHNWEVEGANCARLPVIATISADCSPSCPDELMFDESSISEGTYTAATIIEASGSIASGTPVIFKAGTSITLTEGFYATSGSIFSASIEACSANLVEKMEATFPLENRENTFNKSAKIIERELVKPVAPSVKIFPNPAITTTTIAINLPSSMRVHLGLFDLYGREISTLVDDNLLHVGMHEFYWQCSSAEAGIYFLILNGQYAGKLVIAK